MFKKKTIFYTLIALAYLSVYMFFITDKLIVGARWGGGLFLAGVDNWLSGGSMYTQPSEGLTGGPVYSPGGLFMALIARLAFGYDAETTIIICGGLLGLVALWGFAKMEAIDKKRLFFLWIVAMTFFIFEFPSAKFYLFELHPDIPVLACFVWGVLLICNYLKSNKIIDYLLATFFFLLAGLFKQNALFLFVGLFVFVLFTKRLDIRRKALIVLSEAIAGISTLLIMWSIDGCLYNCVEVMASHSLLPLREYIDYILTGVKDNVIFIVLLLFFIFLLITKRVRLKAIEEEMWAYSSVSWFVFCIYGAAKEGSNSGNIEVALFACMPFVLHCVEYIVTKISICLKKQYSSYVLIKQERICNVITLVSVICCLLISCYGISKSSSNLSRYAHRLNEQELFSEWLNNNFSGNNVAYNAKYYELYNHVNINKKTDLFIAAQYAMGKLIDDNYLNTISQDENWDVIVTTLDLGAQKWPSTFSSFKIINDFPTVTSYGDSLIVYVRK